MTTTATPVETWNDERFAVITARTTPSTDKPRYFTTGHADPSCQAISDPVIANGSTLDEFLAGNEWFDGEVDYETPWPCGRCVHIDVTPRRVAFEAPRDLPSTPAHAVRREVDPQAAADLAEAREYASTYAGTFEFMLDMRLRVRRGGVVTPKMVAAILRCKAANAARAVVADVAGETRVAPNAATEKQVAFLTRLLNERPAYAAQQGLVGERLSHLGKAEASAAIDAAMKVRPEAKPAVAPHAIAPSTLPDVPEGKYAVTADAGHLSFYSVRKPTEGRWAGYTFLDLLIGSPGSWRQQKVAQDQRAAVMAKIAADPQAAAARYGHEFTVCGACDSPLSHERSRTAGYGQVCAAKRGWAW